MAEYIERESTIKSYCEKCKGYYDGHCIHRVECDVDVIETAPAADVQPVKHGKWLKRMSTSDSLKCSVCGNSHEYETTYCPHCGARMDGDTECQ